jgi:hypothetical protein
MKQQADKKKADISFDVGDQVFVKLQPYVQSSLATRANEKLAFKYFGPYSILEKIGSVAYKLALPADSAIHPIFHISQLKKLVSTSPVSSVLPNENVEYQVPEKVLASRMKKVGDIEVAQVLIKWSQMSAELATWEDKVTLIQQFLAAPVWGQAGHQGRGGGGSAARGQQTANESSVSTSSVLGQSGLFSK